MSRVYKPKALRQLNITKPSGKVMYAIGEEKEPGSYGMMHGPFPNESKMLEEIGESNWCIIRFNLDGTDEVIWRWEEIEDQWVSED